MVIDLLVEFLFSVHTPFGIRAGQKTIVLCKKVEQFDPTGTRHLSQNLTHVIVDSVHHELFKTQGVVVQTNRFGLHRGAISQIEMQFHAVALSLHDHPRIKPTVDESCASNGFKRFLRSAFSRVMNHKCGDLFAFDHTTRIG